MATQYSSWKHLIFTLKTHPNSTTMSLMRQVGLLAAGCQPWNLDVCSASSTGERFAYCATLAVYVYEVNTAHSTLSNTLFNWKTIVNNHIGSISSIYLCSNSIFCLLWIYFHEEIWSHLFLCRLSNFVFFLLEELEFCYCKFRLFFCFKLYTSLPSSLSANVFLSYKDN